MASWRPAPRFAVGSLVHSLRLPEIECVIIKARHWSEPIHEWTYQLKGQQGTHRQSELLACSDWLENYAIK